MKKATFKKAIRALAQARCYGEKEFFPQVYAVGDSVFFSQNAAIMHKRHLDIEEALANGTCIYEKIGKEYYLYPKVRTLTNAIEIVKMEDVYQTKEFDEAYRECYHAYPPSNILNLVCKSFETIQGR